MTSIAEKTVKETIKSRSMIRKNGHVVIGLSGGPDSMCLFHVLYNMKDELGIEISVVHLNHKFRPGFAEEDQEFVEKLCKKLGICCYSKTVDINQAAAQRGETPEEAGRIERYKAFDEEARRIEKTGILKEDIHIVVAQNRNDNVETLLMRILRGTGPDGLAGIPYKRKSADGYQIARPLLDVDRKDIEEYCDQYNLMPRIDHTNSETNYSRNKIRLDLLPELKSEYNFNAENALLRLSGLAASDKDFFDKIVGDIMKRSCKVTKDEDGNIVESVINSLLLRGHHPAISNRVVISILKSMGLEQGIGEVHVNTAMDVINRDATGKIVEFPEDYRMQISYGEARFYKEQVLNTWDEEEKKEININIDEIKEEKNITLPSGTLTIMPIEAPKKPKDAFMLIVDKDAVFKDTNVLTIRYRKAGDRMSIDGLKGTKKLQDLFVDEKIPKEKRGFIPVIVDGKDIIWVAGIRSSGKYRIDKDTKEYLLLEWKPKN